jgi:hypothetical protein
MSQSLSERWASSVLNTPAAGFQTSFIVALIFGLGYGGLTIIGVYTNWAEGQTRLLDAVLVGILVLGMNASIISTMVAFAGFRKLMAAKDQELAQLKMSANKTS